jgi:dihydroorotate dehydrogenase electron transfer subunit
MRLELPDARAGQFAMLQVRDGQDPLLRRPFSFHRIDPDEETIEILFRVVGRGTWLLTRCTPGSRLNLIGPLGNSFDPPPVGSGPAVLIAGGIGIAPLFELMVRLGSACESGPKGALRLFYGARTAAELLPPGFFEGLGATIHWSTDDGSFGHEGCVTELFQNVMEQEGLRPGAVYSCGPLAMQVHVARWALACGAPTQLSLESLMACGVGACLGCALPAPAPDNPASDHYVHVCKDGPIFTAGSIQWHKIQAQRATPPIFLYS